VVEAASGRATSRCARRAQISPGTRATVLVELNGIEPSTRLSAAAVASRPGGRELSEPELFRC